MSIKDIVEIEHQRQLVTCEIHLIQEGSFLRAYEYSAWLSCLYLHELKVTHRAFRNIEGTVAFVGFPKTSLEKWLPDHSDVKSIDEKHLLVSLPDVNMSEDTEETFKFWKSEQPVTEQSSKEVAKQSSLSSLKESPTMTGIMRKILEYPLESKSPVDNMLFISSLKKDIVQFL